LSDTKKFIDHTLYEYQFIAYGQLGISLTHPFIDALDAFNQQEKIDYIQIKRDGIQATQYVGIIQTDMGTVNILPKIDSTISINSEQTATRNLITMLCYAYDMPLIAQHNANLNTHQGSWFEVLTAFFAQTLYEQLRQGIEQVYVTIEERQPTLKGRWLIGQQLSKYPHLRHTFDTRYDDFLPDTPLNQVLRYAVEALLPMARLPENQRLLAEIQTLLHHVSLPHHITTQDLDHVFFTRLNERFYPAFQLARLFIESMTQVMQSGQSPLKAFIFDMNVLFERFVAQFLKRHWHRIAGKSHRQFDIQAQMQGTRAIHLAQRQDGLSVFKLKPDLLLRDNLHQAVVIMDTKYKRLDDKKTDLAVSESDIYQMLAYAGRLNCKRVLLLYPSNSGQVVDNQFSIHDSDVKIDIRTINIHQPLHNTENLIQDFRYLFANYLR